LRHGFGVAAVSAGIPLNLVQKWLGHAQLTTTAIYADAVGTEEQDIGPRSFAGHGWRVSLASGRQTRRPPDILQGAAPRNLQDDRILLSLQKLP
jgi:hypothetical protein